MKRYATRHKIITSKALTSCGDKKKPWGLRPTNLNQLFEIKLHKFTWPLYPKDLLSNTYNLIHIHDATTPYCSLVDPLVPLKGLRSSTNHSSIQILEWKIENGVTIKLSLKESIYRIRCIKTLGSLQSLIS